MLPAEPEMVRSAQQLVGVDRELVPFLALLADREQSHLGIADLEDLLREDGAHVRELEEMLGARVGVGAGVDEHGATDLRRDHDRDRRAVNTADSRRMWRSDAASMAPVFPAETAASAWPSATARTARTSDESGFARTASTAWSSMSIASEASISGETVRVEARRPHQHRLDVVGRSVDGAADDLLGRMIPTQSVDCDANHARSIYGASRRSGSTSRPL